MQKEYDDVIKDGIWRLADPPFGIQPIGYKWVYKTKYRVDGSLGKHKEILVEKGYGQKEGVDYTHIFFHIDKWGNIITMFAIATEKDWKIHHMDVKTVF